MNKKITDLFSIGDRVSWTIIKKQDIHSLDIHKHKGIIDEIKGTDALIRMAGKIYRKRVSLYELENETNPYNPEDTTQVKWPGSIGG